MTSLLLTLASCLLCMAQNPKIVKKQATEIAQAIQQCQFEYHYHNDMGEKSRVSKNYQLLGKQLHIEITHEANNTQIKTIIDLTDKELSELKQGIAHIVSAHQLKKARPIPEDERIYETDSHSSFLFEVQHKDQSRITIKKHYQPVSYAKLLKDLDKLFAPYAEH